MSPGVVTCSVPAPDLYSDLFSTPMTDHPSRITKLYSVPTVVGSAAVYPYKTGIIEACDRKAKYADENGNFKYSLCRVVGPEGQKVIWVPRNMAPSIPLDMRMDGLNYSFQSAFKPRNSEQTRCITEVVSLLKHGTSHLFEAPTGMGKTWCTVDIIAKVGKKTIVVVTKEDILDQWVAACEAILGLKPGKGIGFIKGDKVDTVGHGVVIAMVQSISKEARYPEHIFRDFGLAIWDECHRVGADFFSQSCFRLPALLRLGISATPTRKDGREEVIEAHIGPVMVKSTLPPMTPRIISQMSPWHCPVRRKLDDAGRVVVDEEGKVVYVQIAHSPGKVGHVVKMLSNNHDRNRMIVNFVAQCYKKGRKLLVQSDSRDHLEVLSSLIATAGVPVAHITLYVGGLTKKQRTVAKDGMVIMATYGMTAEATDIPDVDTLVMATPRSDVIQIVGRILRYLPDKKDPVVFDIIDGTSSVFSGYAESRARWYKSIGAKVDHMG